MVDYDENSSAQQELVKLQEGRIRGLVGCLGELSPEFVMVDYGCGPGSSAIEAVKPAIEAYRARYADGPISICHADQTGNDWTALWGLAAGPGGYLTGDPALRSGTAVGSFYRQMVAAGSVALATCFCASHWFSRAVHLEAPDSLWFADLTGSARDQVAARAQADWTQFLRCRAMELRSGGFLLVSTLGAVSEEGEVNGTAASGRGTYRAMQAVARSMADDGLIDEASLRSFVFGLWFMTEAEARRALEQEGDLAAAFEVEEIAVSPAPHNPDDLFAHAIGDPDAYSHAYCGYIRAFADSTLKTQLFEPSAGGDLTVEGLAQEFYRRLTELYRIHRDVYACEIWHLTVVLRRR